MLRSVIATFLLLAACDRHGLAPAAAPPMRSPSQTVAAGPEPSPALAPLAWWLGDRDDAAGQGSEHWIAARPEDSWRSTYATIWRRQPDGSWKVLFDTGRIVHSDKAST